MRLLILTAALFLCRVSTLVAQAPNFRGAVWPARIAVGMRQGEQLTPLTVEATKTGWVTITLLSTRPDVGLAPPSMRMISDARDLRRWIARVRAMLATFADTTSVIDRQPIVLGNGRYQLEVAPGFGRKRDVYFGWRACGPGTGSAGPSVRELENFLALLDSAATVAGNREGRPPTLSRPYYAGEVSCPAAPHATNALPPAPDSGFTRVPELGAEFVVDTAGRVEPRSIRFLPGSKAALLRSARDAIARWRYQRAEIDGMPVRQLVQTSVSFRSTAHDSTQAAPPQPSVRHDIVVEATDDGWVHLTHRGPGPGTDFAQEWYDPDSVHAFVTRVRTLNREAEALPRDSNMLLQRQAELGSRAGAIFSAGFFRHGKALEMRAGFVSCAGASIEGEAPVGEATAFEEAAREARRRRRPPVDPGLVEHTAADVACPAWLAWSRYWRQGFQRVWYYPVGIYPASMRRANVRADVLASFVVDTTGEVDMRSVRVMSGADPRAVAAIPATLTTLRFRPATRAGRSVRQRVIQTIRFEPPPVCATPDASPACPRRYSEH